MKLCEIFSQQYVAIETNYGILNVDTSYDEEDYDVIETGKTTLAKLKADRDTLCAAEMIEDFGADDANQDEITVYTGIVKSSPGAERCTIYAPNFWQ